MRRLGSAGLTYTQVFLLVIGFGMASGVIFLFGMWVGRDVAERRLAQEERIVRAAVPVQPTQPAEESKQKEADSAFYRRLQDKAISRLEETPAGVPTPPATPTAAAVSFGATATRVVTRPSERPTERPTPHPTSTARPRPTSTVASAPAARTAEGDGWADAGWTVQVNATTNAEEARALAQRLRTAGFDAYTVQAPTRGGPTWYRVRVGRFSSRDRAKARELEGRLRSEENLPNAFTTPQ